MPNSFLCPCYVPGFSNFWSDSPTLIVNSLTGGKQEQLSRLCRVSDSLPSE